MPDAAVARMVHGGYELIVSVAELAAVGRMLSPPQRSRLKRMGARCARQKEPKEAD